MSFWLRLPSCEGSGLGTLERLGAGAAEPGALLARFESAGAEPLSLRVQRPLLLTWTVSAARSVLPGGAVVARVEVVGGMELDLLGLWMSGHAAFRGIEAADGEGGVTARAVRAVSGRVARGEGLEALVALAAAAGQPLADGEVVVVSDKVVAVATGRTASLAALGGVDPKHLAPEQVAALARRLSEETGLRVSPDDLQQLDHLDDGGFSLGTERPNAAAAALAARILERTGARVDVVIADSDTGVDNAQPLLGMPTLGATPVGATAGLTVYEALRAAAAGEYARGHSRGLPIVVCEPAERNRHRPRAGTARPYGGRLHVALEKELHRGLPTAAYWEGAARD